MRPKGFQIRPPQPQWGTEEDDHLHMVLVHPEIPGNTGNIGRLCAGADIWLHLVEPLGFELNNKYLRRAGLDYWPNVKLCVHQRVEDVVEIFGTERLHVFSTRGKRRYDEARYRPGDALVFGRETRGLDDEWLERWEDRLVTIPITGKVRSLNLSNAAAVAAYEAMRQMDFRPILSPGGS